LHYLHNNVLVIDQSEYIEDRPVPGPFPDFPMTKRESPGNEVERASFLHPTRSETPLSAVKCNCPLWFSRQKPEIDR
jgi:hypothetical protein